MTLREWQDVNPLKLWRQKNGINREHAALMFGVQTPSLRNWEIGFSLPTALKTEAIEKHCPGMMDDLRKWIEKKSKVSFDIGNV